MAARKYIGDRPWTPTSGALTRSPDKAAEGEVGSAVDVMTNSVLQQELLSEGIDIPSSLFNWSVSSNGLGMDADVSTCSVTDYPHDKDTLTTLRDQLVCETKLRLATGAHVEMLKKQNAALVAGLSALIDPKNARKYRSTMRGLLSTSNQSRPYSSADNARYSQFIDSAFASNNADYSESLFSELAEFELRLNEQFDAKLRSLQNDVKAVDDRHAAALERERSSNAENIMKDRVTRSNKLKDKYRERLYNLNQSLRDRKASSSTDAYAYVSELQAQKKAELSAIRCRIEGDYSAAVSDLSKELQMKEQTFADERKNLSG